MNSFDEKYKANIAGLAKANNVDMSVAADMLRSNLAGTTQYKGGGVLDYVQANKDLQAFRSQDTQKPKQKTSQTDLYALQEKKRLQALESARQKALASLKAEKEQINPYYNQALSVVGGQSNLGAKNLQEYLAQRGQTNAGVSAQAELNRQATLNTNFANIENERARRFADIARRETEVQNAYDEGVMQAALDRQMSETQAIQAAQALQAQYEQELRMLGYKNELASQLAYEKAQYDLERELAKIQAKFQADSQLMQMKPSAVSGGGSTGGGGLNKSIGVKEDSDINIEVTKPKTIRTIGAVQNPNPSTYSYKDVYNSIVANRTPEGMRATAQKLAESGADESLIIQALVSLGLY